MKLSAYRGDLGDLYDACGQLIANAVEADTDTGWCTVVVYDADGQAVIDPAGERVYTERVQMRAPLHFVRRCER